MGRRVHRKVRKGRTWVWCSGRQKTRWSGTSCDCGARRYCL